MYTTSIKVRPPSPFQNYLLQVLFVSVIWSCTCHHSFKLSLIDIEIDDNICVVRFYLIIVY
jgi:hypothetical protein